MKYPTAQSLPQVSLSHADAKEFQGRVCKRLQHTLEAYDCYVHAQGRELPEEQWRKVKGVDHLTVYKDMSWMPSDAVWRRPLMTVGTISGSLDDMMFGLVAADTSAMRARTFVMQDHVVHGAVLAELKGPTNSDPFRLLNIKWTVMETPNAVRFLSWPRDTVALEATGIIRSASDRGGAATRIGYHVIESVDLPGYGEFKDQGLARVLVRQCFLYRETALGTIEVFMTGQLGSKSPDVVTLAGAADQYLGCWRAVLTAKNRKIQHMIKNKQFMRGGHCPRRAFADGGSSTSSSSRCARCDKAFGVFSKSTACNMCQLPLCSRCRVPYKLAAHKDITACKDCLINANKLSSFDVAHHQHSQASTSSMASLTSSSWSSNASDTPKSVSRTDSSHSSSRGYPSMDKTSSFDETMQFDPDTVLSKDVLLPAVAVPADGMTSIKSTTEPRQAMPATFMGPQGGTPHLTDLFKAVTRSRPQTAQNTRRAQPSTAASYAVWGA